MICFLLPAGFTAQEDLSPNMLLIYAAINEPGYSGQAEEEQAGASNFSVAVYSLG